MQTLLEQALSKNQLTLSDTAIKKLVRYLELIQKWHKVFNLTTILEPREMVYLHLIDSLVIAPYLQGERLLDVGSGAGLPGIPLAIMQPERRWLLVDKNSKKTRFLTQCIAELSLTNVSVMHSRSEEFHPDGCFDTILSRAFGTLTMFAETTAHLLCPEGRLLAMKGKYPADEIAALPKQFIVDCTKRLEIKGIDIERHLVCLRIKT